MSGSTPATGFDAAVPSGKASTESREENEKSLSSRHAMADSIVRDFAEQIPANMNLACPPCSRYQPSRLWCPSSASCDLATARQAPFGRRTRSCI